MTSGRLKQLTKSFPRAFLPYSDSSGDNSVPLSHISANKSALKVCNMVNCSVTDYGKLAGKFYICLYMAVCQNQQAL